MNQIPNIEETHNTREVEEIIKEFERRMPLITSHGLLLEARLTPTNYQKMKDWLRTTHHHQLQKARVQEKMRIKTLLEDLPAFTPCNDKTMGKVADEAKKPAYLTNYLERETVLKLLAD